MFTDKDIVYHTPDNPGHDWAETSYFSFYVPEARIMAWIYLVARPGVGAIVADVQIIGSLSTDPLGAWYTDIQQHIKLPESFEKMKLSNGLDLEAKSIRDYRIDYVGVDNTEIHVDVQGIMDPYDINDLEMNPMAVADPKRRAASSGNGEGYSNHYDMTCRVRGYLRVRGHDYDVDCIAQMDHSWGRRGERGMSPMCWINAHFSENYAMNAIWSTEPGIKPEDECTFRHGYVLVDGKVLGVKSGTLLAHRLGRFPLGFEMTLTDVNDHVYKAYGSPLSMQLWVPYTCAYVPNVFIRWQSGAHIGYGNSQENHPLDWATRVPLQK